MPAAWRWFLSTPRRRLYLHLLFWANLLGSLYGFYWYVDELLSTPPAMWILVADSPLSTFYFTVVLFFFLRGRRIPWLEALAYFGLIKYGFWTMFIIGRFWWAGGSFYLIDLLLFLSHLAMLVEALLFVATFPVRPRHMLLALGWYVLNDYVDYFRGFHPTYPETEGYRVVRAVSMASTWVIFGYLWSAARRAPSPNINASGRS